MSEVNSVEYLQQIRTYTNLQMIDPFTYRCVNGKILKIQRRSKVTVIKTKRELLEAMKKAQLSGTKSKFSIIVSMPDLPEYEVITNPIENLALKSSYYERAYDDQLRLKANEEIRIIGYYWQETKLSFGEAIDIIKSGGRVAREGWNGKGMCLQAQFPDKGSKMTHPYLFMTIPECEEGTRLLPWQPSQVDIFSMDWMVINNA